VIHSNARSAMEPRSVTMILRWIENPRSSRLEPGLPGAPRYVRRVAVVVPVISVLPVTPRGVLAGLALTIEVPARQWVFGSASPPTSHRRVGSSQAAIDELVVKLKARVAR
jgi:hypothetical protein